MGVDNNPQPCYNKEKRKEMESMKFGMKFVDSCIVELIDMETAEILAEGPAAVQEWLTAYDGNYTLTLV